MKIFDDGELTSTQYFDTHIIDQDKLEPPFPSRSVSVECPSLRRLTSSSTSLRAAITTGQAFPSG